MPAQTDAMNALTTNVKYNLERLLPDFTVLTTSVEINFDT